MLLQPLSYTTRWHADIKPSNILNVHGEFKLADPGLARFESQGDRNKGEKDDVELLGGRETFGEKAMTASLKVFDADSPARGP